jgi:hypothetical protein
MQTLAQKKAEERAKGLTIRKLYDMIGNSSLPWDVQVEIVDGAIVAVESSPRSLPPSPEAAQEGEEPTGFQNQVSW